MHSFIGRVFRGLAGCAGRSLGAACHTLAALALVAGLAVAAPGALAQGGDQPVTLADLDRAVEQVMAQMEANQRAMLALMEANQQAMLALMEADRRAMQAEMAALRTEMAALRVELHAKIDTETVRLENRLILWGVGLAVTMTFGLLAFLPFYFKFLRWALGGFEPLAFLEGGRKRGALGAPAVVGGEGRERG